MENRSGKEGDRRQGREEGIQEKRQELGDDGGKRTGKSGGRREDRVKRKEKGGKGAVRGKRVAD